MNNRDTAICLIEGKNEKKCFDCGKKIEANGFVLRPRQLKKSKNLGDVKKPCAVCNACANKAGK